MNTKTTHLITDDSPAMIPGQDHEFPHEVPKPLPQTAMVDYEESNVTITNDNMEYVNIEQDSVNINQEPN